MRKFLPLLILPSIALARPVTVKNQVDHGFNNTSAVTISANKDRKGLIICDKGPADAYIKFGSAHSSTEGVYLVNGSCLDFENPPMDSIYVTAATSTGANTIGILEFE